MKAVQPVIASDGSLISKLYRQDHSERQEGRMKGRGKGWSIVFVFVLMGWSLLPNALGSF